MLTFYDEKGNGYGARVEFTTKNAVNGERSVSGTILSNDKVLSKIDRGWSFDWDGETYKIIYAKPKDEGRSLSVSFDAVHQFFYDFDHSNCYQVFNGSNRFEVYIEAIFKNSGYRYVIEAQANVIRKENFGNAKRLSMFKDVIKAAGLEFSVTGKVVRIVKKVGTDLSTVVRKNFNMNELTLEKNIGAFITYKKGFGAWKDEENHDAGRYETEYESPLARIYGRIEGEPVSDERYKETGKLLERLKKEVDESYSISVQLDMEDLTQAGYKYTRPRAGDYIMAINETIEFREKIRIVSYESSYDVTGRLLSHKVTCNDIGTVQKAISSEGSIMRSVGQSKEYAESALAIATKALVSADGKNTIYYGAEKPRDQPRGTLHRGDLLYLTVGEETELYFWNGSEWELKHLKFDSSKLEKMFADSKASTEKAIAEANKRAEEALKKAGTLPDTSKLSDQIKQQILSSPDLQNKVTEGVKSVDGDTIYSKIVSKVSQQFANKTDLDSLNRAQTDQGRDLLNLSKQITAQTIEYNKLAESNKLYERILGKSETETPDKLSRLVMSSEIFQTEVGKYSTQGGPNMAINSDFSRGTYNWSAVWKLGRHPLYYNGQKDLGIVVNRSVNELTAPSKYFKVKRNTDYRLNIKVAMTDNVKSYDLFVLLRKKGETQAFTNVKKLIYGSKIPSNKMESVTVSFNTGEYDEGYFRFDNNGSTNGQDSTLYVADIDLYEGKVDRPWQPSPDDLSEALGELGTRLDAKVEQANGISQSAQAIAESVRTKAEAVQTRVTQLAGSWAVKNLNSNGDVLNSINVLANGTNRIDGRLTHITGQTKIDDAVIKDAMIARVNADKIFGGTIDGNQVNVIGINVKNLVGDLSEFSKTLWKSYYSNMEATGEGLIFTNVTGGFLKISNGSGMLTLGQNKKSVVFNSNSRGGLEISMDYDGYFRIGHGKDRNKDAPLIEARRDFVKIGTERNYIRFDLDGAYITINGSTKRL